MGKQKTCYKCGYVLFTIETRECDDCEYNGAWDTETEDFTTDEEVIKNKKLVRNSAFEGECDLGTTEGNGCIMFKCTKCGTLDNRYYVDS